MSKSLTIKNLKTLCETFAAEHELINHQLKGNIFEIDLTKAPDGVTFLWEVTNMTGAGFGGLTYSLDVFVFDNVTDINNESNIVSVQNECSLIALDFLAYVRYLNKSSYADKDLTTALGANWSITPFEKRFDSLYGGCGLDMTIETYYAYERCIIPLNE